MAAPRTMSTMPSERALQAFQRHLDVTFPLTTCTFQSSVVALARSLPQALPTAAARQDDLMGLEADMIAAGWLGMTGAADPGAVRSLSTLVCIRARQPAAGPLSRPPLIQQVHPSTRARRPLPPPPRLRCHPGCALLHPNGTRLKLVALNLAQDKFYFKYSKQAKEVLWLFSA